MSDYREQANKRRDARQAKGPVIRPPGGSKKDTKKWCRGRVGVEHTPVCVDYDAHKRTTFTSGWKILVCSACNKQLDHWWPNIWSKNGGGTPPDWVRD
jgi:hypothetical protein